MIIEKENCFYVYIMQPFLNLFFIWVYDKNQSEKWN